MSFALGQKVFIVVKTEEGKAEESRMRNRNTKENRINWYVIGGIFLLGCLVRIAFLSRYPLGLHQDEAYSAYNAWAVMNYGVDSYGYTRPVYYTVWGSGMSVLYSYLTMPFLALGGVNVWMIRLPQAILGSISVLAAYGLGKELLSKRFGLLFAALLAINPWHIKQSRFGLDANLAVPMLLFAICFLIRYFNGKKKSIWGVAFFFGLTLYSYALTWVVVPVLLLVCILVYRRKTEWNIRLLGAGALLFVMALPLLLFLAVNFGLLPEIRTGVISIPKLPQMRTGEMSLSPGILKKRFLWLVAMLAAQHDDIWWISDATVGSYYYCSAPFILLGMAYQAKSVADCIRKKREMPLHLAIGIWFLTAFAFGCVVENAKFYKVNAIHIPMIFYTALGIWTFWKVVERYGRKQFVKRAAVVAVTGLYAAGFVFFVWGQCNIKEDYSKYGNYLASHIHWYHYEKAIDRAEELTEGKVSVSGLNYINLMLYKKISPQEYLATVEYEGDDLAFRTVKAIDRYHFNEPPKDADDPTDDTVYIFTYDKEELFEKLGYKIEKVTDCYGVAYKAKE